jgi:hypothetical protein
MTGPSRHSQRQLPSGTVWQVGDLTRRRDQGVALLSFVVSNENTKSIHDWRLWSRATVVYCYEMGKIARQAR